MRDLDTVALTSAFPWGWLAAAGRWWRAWCTAGKRWRWRLENGSD
ncbi:hypothetical protein ACLB1E_30260 [Escherichia coli]